MMVGNGDFCKFKVTYQPPDRTAAFKHVSEKHIFIKSVIMLKEVSFIRSFNFLQTYFIFLQNRRLLLSMFLNAVPDSSNPLHKILRLRIEPYNVGLGILVVLDALSNKPVFDVQEEEIVARCKVGTVGGYSKSSQRKS